MFLLFRNCPGPRLCFANFLVKAFIWHGETDFEIWSEERWAGSRSPKAGAREKTNATPSHSLRREVWERTNEWGRKVNDADYEVGAASFVRPINHAREPH